MAWKERTVEQMREEFARRVLAQERSKAALCREYGISRPTGDKWVERFLEGGSIADRSRFNLCTEALTNETFAAVKPVMQRIFMEYGPPFYFLCDNGNPWGTSQSHSRADDLRTGMALSVLQLFAIGVYSLAPTNRWFRG